MKALNDYIKESILNDEDILISKSIEDANNPFVIINNMFKSGKEMREIAEVIKKDLYPVLKFIFLDPNISDEDIFLGGNEYKNIRGEEEKVFAIYHKKDRSNDLWKGCIRIEYTVEEGLIVRLTRWSNISNGTKKMLDSKKFKMLGKILVGKFNLKDEGNDIFTIK